MPAVAALAGLALACAHRPPLRPPPPLQAPPPAEPPPPAASREPARPGPAAEPSEPHIEPDLLGAVHVVKKGETIYRIARTYGIEARDLMEANDLSDPRQLRLGMELFVPGARRPLDVPPLAPGTAAEPEDVPERPVPGPPVHPPSPTAEAPPAAASPPAPRSRAEGGRLRWPVKGLLYSRFGMRQGQRHDGIDVAAPEGAPVTAAADGTVVYAGQQAGYGHVVILRHPGGLLTLYAHNARVLVSEGSRVRAGQAIARVGQSGSTTGPHLHFEVREGTRPRDPLLYLK
ncbi:MAG TPA: M23 family metallopeptidase [Anaeromyxobacteraceae bacterium]|nr:M23 family metallopeptidase [Anaeromyxobacteraceae bacterium]